MYISSSLDDETLIPVFYVKGTQAANSGNSKSIEIVEGEPINTKDGATYQNQAEIILVTKTGGGRITSTPGNYVPNKNSSETSDTDDTTSELVSIIPSTGGNRNYILPVSIVIIALITLGIGVYAIKVKVLKKK